MKTVADYGLIGDLQSAALVHRNGSIEWFCAPRFDSSAALAALVGGDERGFWRIAPVDAEFRIERRYRGDTLVLETTFTTGSGCVTLTDFMPLGAAGRTIVRIVECVAGPVACAMTLAPKMKYGLIAPWTRREGDAWTARVAPAGLCLRSSVALADTNRTAHAVFELRSGERATFILQAFEAHAQAPDPIDAQDALSKTIDWWRSWAEDCVFAGEWRAAVLRSALTLKALSYEPAGSFVAAVTTSLPEEIGAEKNWDYRYCWLRDASFTVEALLKAGFTEEARRWRDWFVTVCVGLPEHLHIMYEVDGERLSGERKIPWLSGFEHFTPVQIANGANTQFQLGVYGNVLMSFEHAQRAGIAFETEHWTLIESVMRYVARVWQRPGNGIWERRDGGRQYVDSKVMAWIALDRGVAIGERGAFAIDMPYWRALQARMHTEICSAGFDPVRNTFTQYYGSAELDASLLLMPLVGFLPVDDPRIVGTVAANANSS
jgi:GH15 family glucan-1,4-alpha-glucosidase